MNTKQNYVGRDSHATTVEQAAQEYTSTSLTTRVFSPKRVCVNEEVYDSLFDLLSLAEGLIGKRGEHTHIEVINELLYGWLISLDRTTTPGYQKKLEIILEVISFLSELQEQTSDLTYLVEQVRLDSEAATED